MDDEVECAHWNIATRLYQARCYLFHFIHTMKTFHQKRRRFSIQLQRKMLTLNEQRWIDSGWKQSSTLIDSRQLNFVSELCRNVYLESIFLVCHIFALKFFFLSRLVPQVIFIPPSSIKSCAGEKRKKWEVWNFVVTRETHKIEFWLKILDENSELDWERR